MQDIKADPEDFSHRPIYLPPSLLRLTNPPTCPQNPTWCPKNQWQESTALRVLVVAVKLLDVEPEKVRWQGIAWDWHTQVLANTPGIGELYYHLGPLSREKDGEELRSIYHFIQRCSFTFFCPCASI